jgi:hypothetical protein
MQINKLAVISLASVAIVAATATPVLACSTKQAPKPVVHKVDYNHKDNKKDDHKKVDQKDCDHKPVETPGQGEGTPTPTPAPTTTPQPEQPGQVLGASTTSTQPAPATLPQTGAGLISLLGLPTLAGAGAGILRLKLRK